MQHACMEKVTFCCDTQTLTCVCRCCPCVSLQGLSWPQLQVLGQVLRDELGADNTLATTLDEVMEKLAERGVRVTREAVVGELKAATSGEYDSVPADKKWAPMFFYDESDNSIAGMM